MRVPYGSGLHASFPHCSLRGCSLVVVREIAGSIPVKSYSSIGLVLIILIALLAHCLSRFSYQTLSLEGYSEGARAHVGESLPLEEVC